MKEIYISDIRNGDRVDSYFMIRRKTRRLTKSDKPYLSIEFADRTGSMEGRVWNNAEEVNAKIQTGDIVTVTGTVEEFRGKKQLKVESINSLGKDEYSFEDFVRVLERREEVLEDVKKMLNKTKNKWVSRLAEEFLSDTDFMKKLLDGVGAKRWHNAYIGGLIEHTLEVMVISDKMCDLYPEADRDVTVLGAFMHDMGKICELDPSKMEYTVEGGLVGHIAIGLKILMQKISVIKDFPKDLSMRLEHVILSHHGEYEQQSPVLPKTLEATIVYHSDDLVSQANAIKEIVASQREEGKDWSDFVSIKNRKYFIRCCDTEAWREKSKGGVLPVEDREEDLFA